MRLRDSLLLAASSVLLAGCFTMQPVDPATPQIGAEVGLDLNDAGRRALGGTIGQQIDQVHGDLVQRDSTGYTLAVTQVDFLQGGSQTWTGEHVQILPSYVNSYYENRLSLPRTLAITALIGGGLALMADQAGSGTGGSPASPTGTDQGQGDKQLRGPGPGLHIPLGSVQTTRALHWLLTSLAHF